MPTIRVMTIILTPVVSFLIIGSSTQKTTDKLMGKVKPTQIPINNVAISFHHPAAHILKKESAIFKRSTHSLKLKKLPLFQ